MMCIEPSAYLLFMNKPIDENDDRCVRIAKRKYKVWPSAYASGAVVQCRKGKIWKKVNEDEFVDEGGFDREKNQGLHGWFARRGGGKKGGGGWVDCNTCRKDSKTGVKKCKACGRASGEKRSKYPACRPTPSQCNKTGTRKKVSSKRISWQPTDESVTYRELVTAIYL